MKIAINGRDLLNPNTGTYVYLSNLISYLAQVDKKNSYVVYIPSQGYSKAADLVPKVKNFKLIKISNYLSWTHFSISKTLFKNQPDIYFTSEHTIPLIKPAKTKIVSMIHGLEHKANNIQLSLIKKVIYNLSFENLLRNSNVIITPSDFVKKELSKTVSEEKIKVIYEGVNSNFLKKSFDASKTTLKKLGLLESSYILCVSTIQPRKNYARIIEAFCQTLKKTKYQIKLCIVGKKGWQYEEILELPKKLGIEGNVIFREGLKIEELAILYSNAVLYINASFEEGFGLPILEAQSCQTLCLVSEIPTFKEIGNVSVVYFNPNKTSDLEKKLIEILKNKNQYNELIYKGLSNAKKFSWRKTAEQTVKLFRGLV